MTKAEIRREMLMLRGNLNPMQVNLLSNTIFDNLTMTKEYYESDIVYLYASFNNEADTTALIDRALSDKKRVALPCSYMSDGVPKMDFYFINSLTDLVPGYKGIMEPDRRKTHIQKTELMPDIFVIPGVAFDMNLNRLGYGKGFYDRYLSLHNYTADSIKPILIGLSYSFQTSHEIPVTENDIKMNMLVTENGVIYG